MSRIGKAYEARFRALLLRLRARKVEAGVRQLTALAQQGTSCRSVSLNEALGQEYEHLRNRVRAWEGRSLPTPPGRSVPGRFLCDAGLGGLARWLRAAGYEAIWFPDIDDADLLRRARQLGAIVLTTDSLMMERGILRDGIMPSFWLPPTLTKEKQLGLVFREFSLTVREPRCMQCGGELHRVDKESQRNRIPPKTWRWIGEYFVCSECDRLFWRGTHWRRIQAQLDALESNR